MQAPAPSHASEVPWYAEAITPAWMQSALAGQIADAEVKRLQILGGDDGSSYRRRKHIEWNQVGENAGLPENVFTKSAPTFAMRLSGGIAAASEGRFLLEVAPTLPIEAPRCWYAKRDAASGRAMQVMEDLTVSKDATFLNAPAVVSIDTAKRMLDLLATLHGTFMARPETMPTWLGTYEDFFNAAARSGIREAHFRAMEAAQKVLPRSLVGRGDAIWTTAVAQLALHATTPRTVIHSDVHPGNWYLTHAGQPGLCDWARVCRAHWARDVVYVLSSVLSIEDRRAGEMALLASYAERLSVYSGQRFSVNQIREAMRQQLCAALLMWTPTLCPPPTLPAMQPEAVSLEMISRIAAAIDDHDAINAGIS